MGKKKVDEIKPVEIDQEIQRITMEQFSHEWVQKFFYVFYNVNSITVSCVCFPVETFILQMLPHSVFIHNSQPQKAANPPVIF